MANSQKPKEYALLHCGLIVGPVQQENDHAPIISTIPIWAHNKDGVGEQLTWNYRGIIQGKRMSNSYDIIEKFQLIRGLEDGGGVQTTITKYDDWTPPPTPN